MKTLLISTALGAFMASSALAADMVEIVDVPEAVVGYSWSGLYVGAHIGAAWGGHNGDSGCDIFKNLTKEGGGAPTFDSASDIEQADDDYSVRPTGLGDNPDRGCFEAEADDIYPAFALDGDYVAFDGFENGEDDTRFLGGVQLGINQQYGRLVVGLETDFSWLSSGDNDSGGEFGYFHGYDRDGDDVWLEDFEGVGTVSIENKLDWLATFRARAGGAFGNEGRLFIYGTAGVGVAGVSNSISGSWDDYEGDSQDWCDDDGDCQFSSNDDDDDDYKVGLALGVGAEYAFTDNLSFGLEYLYVGFNDDDNGNSITFFGDDGRSFDIQSSGGIEDIHTVRAKLNWKFRPQG